MELLAGETLVRKNQETVLADEALQQKEVVAFYFGAHWCPPCRRFTPVLADFYETLVKARKPLEIIFVSDDPTAEGFFSFMEEAHGNWLAVPHGSELANKLKQKFDIQGIPALIVLKKDGSIVTDCGRVDVERKNVQAFDDWVK